jgi:hypothetical protein
VLVFAQEGRLVNQHSLHLCRLATLAAIAWLGGISTSSGQVIENPFVKDSRKANATKNRPQYVPSVGNVISLVENKQKLERALNDLYRMSNNLAARGRIWAENNDDWTDIRIIESNLAKAAKHFAAGAAHWEAARYSDWHREWTQAGDVMERSLPQLQRIEQMIDRRRRR